MKKGIALMFVIIGFLVITYATEGLALNVGEVQTKTNTINQNENIVFVGDSIFDWYPTEKIFSDFPIVNSGIVGNKTTDILANMEERIYKYRRTAFGDYSYF